MRCERCRRRAKMKVGRRTLNASIARKGVRFIVRFTKNKGESMHFADRLLNACRQKGNAVCAGIDPRCDLLPLAIRQRHPGGTLDAMAAAFEEFSLRVLDIVAPLVPVV